MNDYELIMVVLGIISAVLTALALGYKFGSKKVDRRLYQILRSIS